MSSECKHARVKPDVYDQTVGVYCIDCDTTLHVCWMDDHIPESLWNRACLNDADTVPCGQNRDDVCAIGGHPIATEPADVPSLA